MPYARSWIDQLTAWIDRLPGPSWLIYVTAVPLIAIMSNVVFWIDGSQAVGTFEFVKSADTIFTLFFFALYHYLSKVAGQCFVTFAPVLKLPEADLKIRHYRLTTLPRWIGWLTLVGGSTFAVIDVQLDPVMFGIDKTQTLLPLIYQSVGFVLTQISLSSFFIQMIRQLRIVNNLHQQASEVDMFHLAPFHAFAKFTARAGSGLVLFLAYNGLYSVFGYEAVPLIGVVIISVLAVCIFVIPLIGMQHRLQDEKERLLDVTNEAIKVTLGRIHGEVNANSYEKISDLNTAMSSLVAERDLINGISTWPWNASTLRSFASTLVLPIFLWLVTRVLERFF